MIERLAGRFGDPRDSLAPAASQQIQRAMMAERIVAAFAEQRMRRPRTAA